MTDEMKDLLNGKVRIHFVGIGGIGMMALAQYLIAAGMQVSGSDTNDKETLQSLREIGIQVFTGHDPSHVDGADLVIVTSALSEGNTEVSEARRMGIPIAKRSQILGEVVNDAPTIAVAGTHGKTTTTGLIGCLLRTAGTDVTILGGGFVRRSDSTVEGPAVIGSAPSFVVEADEYDRGFHFLSPSIAVITNLEFDHPDCYSTVEDVQAAFLTFAGGVRDHLIVSGGSCRAVAVAAETGLQFETFGVGSACTWCAAGVDLKEFGSSFEVLLRGESAGRFETRLVGLHNIQNSLAALAAACAFTGLGPRDFASGLRDFHGMVRRLERRGLVGGVAVVDDYAHHPTEIRATLDALRAGNPGRLRAAFQPHTFSRTKALQDDFVDALSLADEVVLLDVYAAREQPIQGVESRKLVEALNAGGTKACYSHSQRAAAAYLAATAEEGDQTVTMGAGDIAKLPGLLLRCLEERFCLVAS